MSIKALHNKEFLSCINSLSREIEHASPTCHRRIDTMKILSLVLLLDDLKRSRNSLLPVIASEYLRLLILENVVYPVQKVILKLMLVIARK